MKELWSPLKAAFVVFLIIVAVGLVAGVVVMTATGKIHDHSFARGETLGQGIGTLAVVAGVATYFVQAKRRG